MHKITPFLPYIKGFFKNPDMTAAMQSISSVLTQFKMIEQHILDVTSKRNCVYSFRLIRVIRVPKYSFHSAHSACPPIFNESLTNQLMSINGEIN